MMGALFTGGAQELASFQGLGGRDVIRLIVSRADFPNSQSEASVLEYKL